MNKEGISYIDIPAYPSCLKEYSNANVGATSEVVEIQTHPPAIVLWQSPNKNPRDKCKEFSGRIAMHINTWNSKSQVFEKRNINAYMILDGKWSDKDIQELLRFGFNNVFYVDEIPKLIDEIKTLVPEDISPLIERVNAVAAENRTKKTVHPIIKKVSSKLLTDFDRRKFLDSLNETEFEKLMLHCYSQQGFSGKLTPVTGDGGIDIDMLDISKDGERWLVQCKKYSKNIPIRDIRDFMGTLSREGVKFGVFAATSNFTSGADRDIKKAKKKAGIEVILLNRESILEKMRDVYTVPEVTYDMVLKVKFEW